MTDEAVANLDMIINYVAQFNLTAAVRLAERLIATADRLSEFSDRGRACPVPSATSAPTRLSPIANRTNPNVTRSIGRSSPAARKSATIAGMVSITGLSALRWLVGGAVDRSARALVGKALNSARPGGRSQHDRRVPCFFRTAVMRIGVAVLYLGHVQGDCLV